MVYSQKRYRGVTLLEMLLVLAIVAMFMYFSMQQYQSFRRDADIQQLKLNVDMLFAAAAKYFKANCTQGNFRQFFAAQSFTVPISTLQNQGYLSQTLATNPYVDYSSPAVDGYIVQFNQFSSGGALPNRMHSMSPAGSRSMGSVVIWSIQVSVNLKTGYSSLKGPLLADCLSDYTGGFVRTCATSSSGATQFAVFERLPSFVSSKDNSVFWVTMPTVKQFRQMYTTDPILILVDPVQTTQLNNQYYICGT